MFQTMAVGARQKTVKCGPLKVCVRISNGYVPREFMRIKEYYLWPFIVVRGHWQFKGIKQAPHFCDVFLFGRMVWPALKRRAFVIYHNWRYK